MSEIRPRELSIAFQTDKTPGEYADLALVVEGYGFDVLSMYSDLMFQAPIVPLAIAAQATRHIRLGPASLNPSTLHPVEIAGQIATLDMLSGGRAYLGISRGAWLESLGLSEAQPVSRVTEAIEIINHLLAGRTGAYEGRHFRLTAEHRLRYRPLRPRVPLLLGSWGQRLIQAAAGMVEEIKLGGSTNPDIVPVARRWLAGAPGDAPRIVLGAVTVVDEDREAARRLIRREMALYLPVVAPLDPTFTADPEMLSRLAELGNAGEFEAACRLIPDEVIDRFAFAGDPSQIIEQCERIFDVGAARIEFGTPHGLTARDGLDLLGRRVLPALAAWRT